MKAKVLKRFIDKETKVLNEIGTEINITKERFEELKAAGNYVEPIKNTKSKAPVEEPTESE